MARDLTTAYKVALTAGTVRPLLLVTGVFDSETLRFWNGLGTLTFDGQDYVGAGQLLRIDPITETQKTEARGMKLELSGVPSDLIAVALQEDYQDRQVTIDLALTDTSGVIILDPFRFFSGKADVMEIEEGAQSAVIVLSAESDLITLKRVTDRRRTPEDQKLTYPSDTFFDSVAALQSKEILWGKDVE